MHNANGTPLQQQSPKRSNRRRKMVTADSLISTVSKEIVNASEFWETSSKNKFRLDSATNF